MPDTETKSPAQAHDEAKRADEQLYSKPEGWVDEPDYRHVCVNHPDLDQWLSLPPSKFPYDVMSEDAVVKAVEEQLAAGKTPEALAEKVSDAMHEVAKAATKATDEKADD